MPKSSVTFAEMRRCDKEAASQQSVSRACTPEALQDRRSGAQLRSKLDAGRDGRFDDTLVLAVMVPGNAFVGAEEARRRTRYGVLTALQAEGYLPDNAEYIGLLNLDIPALQKSEMTGKAGKPEKTARPEPQDRLLMPYELLSPRRALVGRAAAAASGAAIPGPRERYKSVALLWVDESALPAPKFDGLAWVLNAVAGPCELAAHCPQLAVIGPASSEGLRTAASWLKKQADAKAQQGPTLPAMKDPVRAGYRLLSQATFFNASATIADSDLQDLGGQPMEQFLQQCMGALLGSSAADAARPRLRFTRTIASDDIVLQALKDELARRLPVDPSRRVVLITESDSIYARTLDRRFSQLIGGLRGGRGADDHVFFFRGVDGVTVREGPDQAAPAKSDPAMTVEWPESRDQLDYLRRVVADLRLSESLQGAGGGPIGAIGIFANDVHDKLLILQALNQAFPDKVFFTTDMDARYVHPRTLPFTRNLVVASSLPLRFPAQAQADDRQRSLQAGTPPLRDTYQAAAYLAARLAACLSRCDDIQQQARAVIGQPTVYEIGRDHAVALLGPAALPEPSTSYHVGLLVYLVLLVLAVLVWPSTPSMQAVRDGLRGVPVSNGDGVSFRRSAMAFAVVYAGLFGCAAGSVVEASFPGRLALSGLLGFGASAAVLAGLACMASRRRARHADVRLARALPLSLAGGLLLLLVAIALLLLRRPPAGYQGEPMAWLQGISAWPSQLLNLLALVCGVATLDRLWSGIAAARRADEAWLGLTGTARTAIGPGQLPAAVVPTAAESARSAARPAHLPRSLRSAWRWMSRRTLVGWRSAPAVVFADIWRGYQMRGAAVPRGLRVAFWWVTTVLTVVVFFWAFSDHELPVLPVRGTVDRLWIGGTYSATLLLLPLVVVAVADATMLAWRLLRMLGRQRTLYEPQTVRRFAQALGSLQANEWMHALAAEPADRQAPEAPAGEAPGHTLLDDWIDIQVIARRTQAVAPLVVAPFVMLALMVVARSRLFDNWSLTWPIATTVALYVLWLGVLALLLKQAAETCRERALARMNADLRWMAGADDGRKALVEPFKRLIDAVETERRGAFAPPFDQPFFKGLLVPLGGAGGAQLFERLLLAP